MWIVTAFLLGVAWREVRGTQCDESPLYPVNTCGGFGVLQADDATATFTPSIPIQFYGNTYNGITVDTNGYISLGPNLYYTLGGLTGPANIPIIGPGMFDVVTELPGALVYGQASDPASLLMATSDTVSVGVPINNPDVVAVFTWYNVRRYGYGLVLRSTFQMVLIADASNTVLVLNYATDFNEWTSVGVQLHAGNSVDWVEIPGSRTAATNQLYDKSNSGVPGRIVMDVTGPTITAPVLVSTPRVTLFRCPPVSAEPCLPPITQCTVDATTGDVNTFDGLQATPSINYNAIYHQDRSYIISKQWYDTVGAHLDMCKFLLIGITDGTGKLHKVQFFVGVGVSEEEGFVRDYMFGMNVVKPSERIPKNKGLPAQAKGNGGNGGQDKASKGVLKMPFTETFDDNNNMFTIDITNITADGHDGWLLTSDVCTYEMTYVPGHPSAALVLQLGGDYQSKPLKGLCQNNYNNDPLDDFYDCGRATSGVPDWYSGADDIADDCSCGFGDHACSNWQITEIY